MATLMTDVLAFAARRVHEDHSSLPQFLELLIHAGDITREQSKSAWLEPGSLEHECADLFHSGGITRVYFTGEVEFFSGV